MSDAGVTFHSKALQPELTPAEPRQLALQETGVYVAKVVKTFGCIA